MIEAALTTKLRIGEREIRLRRHYICEDCLEKQRKIDKLEEENQRLKQKLNLKEKREKEGFFGSSTPSSQKPIKNSSSEENRKKKGGGKAGHKGAGRKPVDRENADRIEKLLCQQLCCPNCQGLKLKSIGSRDRGVIDIEPVKPLKIVYELERKKCQHCSCVIQAMIPGVLPKFQLGNELLAHLARSHYIHGAPVGRLAKQLNLKKSTLLKAFSALKRYFAALPDVLAAEYRAAKVRYSDETGWRTDGKPGYAWLFSTDKISFFQFGKTRESAVVLKVLGSNLLDGYLIVDRYGGYNRVPTKIQYCYAHLLRDVEDLEKQFPESSEIKGFVSEFAKLLADAMSLRSEPISDAEYLRKASEIKTKILEKVSAPAQHLGIKKIQDIFLSNPTRLYYWVEDRDVPAHNNYSERQIRFVAISRKVSFGSQSKDGADTRSVLTSVLHTLEKLYPNPEEKFKEILDRLAEDPNHDVTQYFRINTKVPVPALKKPPQKTKPAAIAIRPMTAIGPPPSLAVH